MVMIDHIAPSPMSFIIIGSRGKKWQQLFFFMMIAFLVNYHNAVNSFQIVPLQTSAIASAIVRRRTSKNSFPTTNHHHSEKTFPTSLLSSKNDNNNDFIDYILSPPSSNDPSFQCTHMIGIPLEQNHDLLLELESIQRAVLYHCPLLIHACIAPVVTRMPLLLVDTRARRSTSFIDGDDGNNNNSSGTKQGVGINFNTMFQRNGNGSGTTSSDDTTNGLSPSPPGENDLLTSRDPITRTIHDIVNSVVDEMINIPSTTSNHREGEEERDGVNDDNIQPLLLKFEGLEIDGDLNEVLNAIGTEDEGTIQLRTVLKEITKRIEQETGWKTYLPDDNPQGKVGGLNEDDVTWRPRIPFMRLPDDFFDTLPNPVELYNGKKWEDCTEDEKMSYVRLPDEGGNGISPLFWFKWMEDALCHGKSIRIRELAVYGRTGPMGMTEQAFYIPHLRTPLPDGNSKLQEDERRDREYDNQRRLEQEMMIDGPPSSISSGAGNGESLLSTSENNEFEKEMAAYKSNADRQILQTIFDSSPDEGVQFDDNEEIVDRLLKTMDDMENRGKLNTQSEDVEIDQQEREEDKQLDRKKESVDVRVETSERQAMSKEEEIIQSIAKPMATGDWSKFQKKKNKPRPEDNPILRGWKQRIANSPKVIDVERKESKPLPPFPSDEHFVGIWTLDSTPGRKVIDEEKMLIDPNSSENMVLRVDGTIGGGPILDAENLHRAAGGTWKFFQAQYVGSSRSEGDIETLRTRLRIRLLIPPEKERVLVFEGEVKQGAFASPESISQDNMNELRKSSFANLLGQNDSLKSLKSDTTFMQCSGEMWTENVRGEKYRSKVGKFILSKRQESETNYKYSIPAPQRYQD